MYKLCSDTSYMLGLANLFYVKEPSSAISKVPRQCKRQPEESSHRPKGMQPLKQKMNIGRNVTDTEVCTVGKKEKQGRKVTSNAASNDPDIATRNERVNRQASLPRENEQHGNSSQGVSARKSQENTMASNRYAALMERTEEELRELTMGLEQRNPIEMVATGSKELTLQNQVNLNGMQNITGRGEGSSTSADRSKRREEVNPLVKGPNWNAELATVMLPT